MTPGAIVRIRGNDHEAHGHVLAILSPAALPGLEIEHSPHAAEVRNILDHMGVTQIALIGYSVDNRDVMFAALQTPNGWFDLHQQPLEIEE